MVNFLIGLALGVALGYAFRERIRGIGTMVASFLDRFDWNKGD